MSQTTMTMIFSVDRQTGCEAKRNAYFQTMTIGMLKAADISYQYAEGCYREDGEESFTKELSFICTDLTLEQCNLIRVIAKASNQDTILYMLDGSICYLGWKENEYAVGFENSLGHWQQVERSQAIENGCYTRIAGKHYIAK